MNEQHMAKKVKLWHTNLLMTVRWHSLRYWKYNPKKCNEQQIVFDGFSVRQWAYSHDTSHTTEDKPIQDTTEQ